MNPIYPDKTKTGLAALKPLTDVFFAEPERWEWERGTFNREYEKTSCATVIKNIQQELTPSDIYRLTPKPRRVWIGDQSYPEPLDAMPENVISYIASIHCGKVVPSSEVGQYVTRLAAKNGYLFATKSDAQQCLDAHRKARRVE